MGSSRLPRPSGRDCLSCGTPIIIRKRWERKKVYCDPKCQAAHRRIIEQRKREARKVPCRHCGEPFVPSEGSVFCSPSCASLARRIYYDRVCENCGIKFQVRNVYQIKRGDHRYCSRECYKRKYRFTEVDLGVQSPENAYWLGFMYGSLVEIDETKVVLEADRHMLESLNRFVSGNMPVVESATGHRLTFWSRPFSRKMRLLGLRDDLYQEAPMLDGMYIKDFIRGYFDGPRGFVYTDGGRRVVAIHGRDSKLMRYFADMTGGRLAYKSKEWVVVCQGFEMSCAGLPRNAVKWERLGAPDARVSSWCGLSS